MNWLSILLVFVKDMRNENLCEVQRVYFIENDYWCANPDQFLENDFENASLVQNKIYEGYLSRVRISTKDKLEVSDNIDYYLETCYLLKTINRGYLVMKGAVLEKILAFVKKSKENELSIKLDYLFTDKPIKNAHDLYNYVYDGKKRPYITSLSLKEMVEDSKNDLRSENTDYHKNHLKDILGTFLLKNLFGIKKYAKILNNFEKEINEMEKDADLDLYYFESRSDCFRSLKSFVEDLLCFMLVDDEFKPLITCDSTGVCINETNVMKTSKFKLEFWTKSIESLKKLYDIELDQDYGISIIECYDYLKDRILGWTYLPIQGKYDIDYYIEQFSYLACKAAKKTLEEYASTKSEYDDEGINYSEMKKSLGSDLDSLQLDIIKDICDSEYILKHFSEMFGKEIETEEDYINIDKIVADYHNVFEYKLSLYFLSKKQIPNSRVIVTPTLNVNYNIRIVDGIKIRIDSSFEFGEIRGFDDNGESGTLEKDIDYFIDENILYCPSEILKMKNIQEIEIISLDEENSMRFNVNEYLKV